MSNETEWVLVPREPTQAMLDAGHWPCVQGRGAKSVWATMLASAPQPPAEAKTMPDWDAAPPGATHYQPHQDAYYKRVSASEWYVWCPDDDRGLMRWLPSLGTRDNAEWVVRPAEAQAQGGGEVAMEAWNAALNDAGELRTNAPDGRYERRAQNVEAWIRGNRPSPPSAPVGVEAAADVLHKLRRLALVIREHGTCAPLALDHIGDDLERALAQQPAAVDGGKVAVRESKLRYCIRELNGARQGDNPQQRAEIVHGVLTAALAAQPGGSDNDH